jgi:glycosyltransferase involved in cell wall biosynthesis
MLEGGTLINSYGLQIDWQRDWAIQGDDLTGLLQTMLGGRLFLNLLRKSQAFYQVLSRRSYSYLVAQGFPAERIIMIPGSVDAEKFRPVQERMLEHASIERKIICIARLEYSKGIDILLHAWANMLSTSSNSRWQSELKPVLHLVGEGRFRKQLEHMAVELGIQDSVKFHGNCRDIVLLLQQSWGFVLPSRWEGMPNALLEAMSVGLPCVASRVSGSEDVIANGINGLLVEPEHPIELSQALRRIIEDIDLVQRLGHAARTTILDNYQLANVAKRLVELYQRLLSEEADLVLM